jgi:hypothetical protein
MDGVAGLIATATVKPACLWCDTGFEPRKGGGAPQRFCQPKCRDAFHSAGRRFAENAVLTGLLTVAVLRNGSLAPCMLDTARERSSGYPTIGYEETAPSEAQRASARDTVLEQLSINAEGIVDLCTLGWLHPNKLQDPGAIGDAVTELANAAISMRLRPGI